MQTNAFPRNDASENTTGCCPRFKPADFLREQLAPVGVMLAD